MLAGISKDRISKLQRVQKNAARLTHKVPKFEHITPLLKELHWLLVQLRIEYKIALLCFKALNSLCPLYVKDLLKPYVPNRELRSCSNNTLEEPLTRLKTYGDRSFSSYAPLCLECSPKQVRETKTLFRFQGTIKNSPIQDSL